MHLRRALLLFAIVVGLAAVVASVSQPRTEERSSEEPAPARSPGAPRAAPAPARGAPVQLRFEAGRRARTRHLAAGRPAVVTVDVSEPGQVELEGLGSTLPAEPVTPARFDLYATTPGRHAVRFTPAGESDVRVIGMLVVDRK